MPVVVVVSAVVLFDVTAVVSVAIAFADTVVAAELVVVVACVDGVAAVVLSLWQLTHEQPTTMCAICVATTIALVTTSVATSWRLDVSVKYGIWWRLPASACAYTLTPNLREFPLFWISPAALQVQSSQPVISSNVYISRRENSIPAPCHNWAMW